MRFFVYLASNLNRQVCATRATGANQGLRLQMTFRSNAHHDLPRTLCRVFPKPSIQRRRRRFVTTVTRRRVNLTRITRSKLYRTLRNLVTRRVTRPIISLLRTVRISRRCTFRLFTLHGRTLRMLTKMYPNRQVRGNTTIGIKTTIRRRPTTTRVRPTSIQGLKRRFRRTTTSTRFRVLYRSGVDLVILRLSLIRKFLTNGNLAKGTIFTPTQFIPRRITNTKRLNRSTVLTRTRRLNTFQIRRARSIGGTLRTFRRYFQLITIRVTRRRLLRTNVIVYSLTRRTCTITRANTTPRNIRRRPIRPMFLVRHSRRQRYNVQLFQHYNYGNVRRLTTILTKRGYRTRTLVGIRLLNSISQILMTIRRNRTTTRCVMVRLGATTLLNVGDNTLPFRVRRTLNAVLAKRDFTVRSLLQGTTNLITRATIVLQTLRFYTRRLQKFFRTFRRRQVRTTTLTIRSRIGNLFITMKLLVATLTNRYIMRVNRYRRLYYGKSLITLRPIQMTTTIPPLIIPTTSDIYRLCRQFILPSNGPLRSPNALNNINLSNNMLFLNRTTKLIRSLFQSRSFTSVIRHQYYTSRQSVALVRLMTIHLLHRLVRRRTNRNTSIRRVLTTLTITRLRRVTRGISRRRAIILFFMCLVNRGTNGTLLLYMGRRHVLRPTRRRSPLRQTTSMVNRTRVVNTLSTSNILYHTSRGSQSFLLPYVTLRRPRRVGTIRFQRSRIRRRRHSVNTSTRGFSHTRTILNFRVFMTLARGLLRRDTISLQIVRSRCFLF